MMLVGFGNVMVIFLEFVVEEGERGEEIMFRLFVIIKFLVVWCGCQFKWVRFVILI